MTYRVYGALIAALGAGALLLPSNDAFARSGAAPRGGFAPTHAFSHPSLTQSFRHHRRNDGGAFWPAVGDYAYGPNGEPIGEVAPPPSGDIHYTYTYDVPWDWAHRFPPAVAPSDRPYVPSCPTEAVAVPGRDGSERTVNVMRCY
jgi:hypothetical protein